jgi:O-antigen ligase
MNNSITQEIKKTSRLRILVILLSCVLPIQIMGRAAIAGTLLLAFSYFLSLPNKKYYLNRAVDVAKTPIGLALFIVALLWIPNVVQSSDPIRSVEAGIRTFIFIGLATIFWAVLIENKIIHDLFCRSFIIASGFSIFIALIAEFFIPELYWFINFKGWRDIPLKTSLKSFSALSVFIVPALLWVGFWLKGNWFYLAVATSIGFTTLVVLTYNRSAIAGLVAMILVSLILVSISVRSRIMRIGLPLGAVAIFIVVIIWLNMTRQRPDFDGDWYFPLWLVDYQRQSIWKFAAELTQKNFWFGMGINTINFAPGADNIIPNTLHNLKMIPSHPHNWVIEIAAETGICGLLSLLVVICMSFMHMVRKFFHGADISYLVSIGISTGYWVSGLFNFSFWSAWWQVSFMLITALCLSLKADISSK